MDRDSSLRVHAYKSNVKHEITNKDIIYVTDNRKENNGRWEK